VVEVRASPPKHSPKGAIACWEQSDWGAQATEGKAGRGLAGLLLESLNRFLIPDHFDGVGLGLSAGNEVELGFGAEVLELGTGSPADIHGLDFLRVELVGGVCAFASELHTETSEVAQIDLVACQQLFLEASDCVSQNALDSTLREGRVVVGDVLAESVQVETLVNLSRTVSLSGIGLLGLLRARLARHNCDTVINHNGPLPTSPFGGGVLYSAERIAGAKVFLNLLTAYRLPLTVGLPVSF